MTTNFISLNLAVLHRHATMAALRYQYIKVFSKSQPVTRSGVRPEVSSTVDIVWAGEEMIEISFKAESVPNGPLSLLAFFPRGRPMYTAQAYVAMSAMAGHAGIHVPKVIWYAASVDGDMGTDVVFLEKAPGESLDKLWPTLTNKRRKAICRQLAGDLLKLFHHRVQKIFTARFEFLGGPFDLKAPNFSDDTLLARPFDHGPLLLHRPQQACETTAQYLTALAERIDRVFDEDVINSPTEDPLLCWPGRDSLSSRDMILIRDTWVRLKKLVPYHTGGWYLPASLPPSRRAQALLTLQSKMRTLCHPDLSMARIVVHFAGREPVLTLTGWQHARFAPLWSCARLPRFIEPSAVYAQDTGPITDEERKKYGKMVLEVCFQSREWRDAHLGGEVERVFEDCLGAHWKSRDRVERLLVLVKERWEELHPDVPFPVTAVDGDDFERLTAPEKEIDYEPPEAENVAEIDELINSVITEEEEPEKAAETGLDTDSTFTSNSSENEVDCDTAIFLTELKAYLDSSGDCLKESPNIGNGNEGERKIASLEALLGLAKAKLESADDATPQVSEDADGLQKAATAWRDKMEALPKSYKAATQKE